MSLESILLQLKKEYLEQLPEKISLINEHFKNNEFELLRDDFHKLKGSGKTYGIEELTVIGQTGEEMCEFHAAKIGEAIPVALELLKLIHSSRAQQVPLILEEKKQFQRLRQLLL